MYQALPTSYAEARPLLDRFLQENASTVLKTIGSKKQPYPPRDFTATPGTQEVLLTWKPPVKASDITGWNIYRDTESNRVLSISNGLVLQAAIKVPASTPIAFFIAAVNGRGTTSKKVQVIASANDQQVVTAGTSGGTNGTPAVQTEDYYNNEPYSDPSNDSPF